MKITEKIRAVFRRQSQTNLSLIIYSAVIAVLLWFAVSLTLYPSVPKTIEDVTLDLAVGSTSIADSSLSVISCDVEQVTVKITGSRTQIANIESDTISAYVDTDNVTTAGRKNLPIKIKSTNGIEFEVNSVSPSTVAVVFDKYESMQFPVSPQIPNVTFEKSKTINSNEFSCEPDIVTITGPSAQLNKIKSVNAVSNKEMTLDSSHALSSDEIQLLTEDGTVIDPSMMTFSTTNFLINIPVLTKKTVGMYVQIVNAPSDFDQSSLRFNLSADSITIASKNSQAEMPDSLKIGTIILSDITPDYSKTFDLAPVLETQNCINLSGLNSVTVTLESDNIETKTLSIDQSRINISNIPDKSYDYAVLTQNLTFEIAGPSEVVSEVTANDIIADVNLLNASITEEQFTYDVIFSCPKYDNIWAMTNCKVSIQRTPQETTTAAADDLQTESTTTTAEQ
ncbi:MAG: hypothetical protein K2J08_05600 [Ruminococcus sp.]|nr:hypothetical protein [Ruminococcus sp.]